ncbi:MAG: hypothetical protein RMJ67_05470 [Elusimicrobiota bacterium]|nr:hypothetical protein [Endomicrobiia bacterium]MCX7910949.1 hypothetical protein [Endomicrobiia bacterium]MDW8165939.1 hypothetical protein [Elusimicrobiota bacterium]
MQNLEQIFKKIEEETQKKIQQITYQTEQKKLSLKERYEELERKEKEKIEKEMLQDFELNKKRIYTENVIKYHRRIEELKNSVFSTFINIVKDIVLNLTKQEYYELIKTAIIKNAFLGEKNYIVFDKTEKLNLEEKKKLLREVSEQLIKLNPKTEIEIRSDKNVEVDFGISIFSNQKNRKFVLDTIIENLKPQLEQKLNELFKEVIK